MVHNCLEGPIVELHQKQTTVEHCLYNHLILA